MLHRIRKVTDRYAASGSPPQKNERLYLSEGELYREYAGDGTTITLERTTDHISDEQGRFALQERTGTQVLLRYSCK